MTKRRKSAKKNVGISIGAVILVLCVVCVLAVGDWFEVVDVDWQGLTEGTDLEDVVSVPGAGRESRPIVTEPVSGEWYRLYFTSPQYPDEVATRNNTVPEGLIDVINSAQNSLDIAIYELELEAIGDAVLAAQRRGVQVRIVTDDETMAESETLIILDEAGIPMVNDDRSPIMHNKFVVVDGSALWTGSWNFTPNDTYRNNNNAIYIQSPQLAQNFTTEFNEMFDQGAFGITSPSDTPNPRLEIGDTLVESCFAPEDGCGHQLAQLLSQAQETVHFMAFSFTHDEIGQTVLERAAAGVDVQGVFETRGSETEYSEYGLMRAEGLDVWQDGNPYTLHHKVFIIDGAIVVLGSFNFSANADEANDENVLVIHNPALAQQYLAEFERVYQQAQNPPNQ